MGVRPAAALRDTLAAGYGRADLRADVMAGLVVGIVALPLSMALAIASGVPPQHGLYTAIAAGTLIALLGGSRTQVSGPTAAFVVLLAPVSHQYGLAGLMVASAMAGVILIAMGLGRMGRLVQFIPHPVTTGFTAGIAVVIATLQLKDLLGLTVEAMPEHYVERVVALVGALPTARWQDVAVGAGTLVVLRVWPRVTSRVPAPLVALLAATLVVQLAGVEVATIGSRFSGGIPQVPPLPGLPWEQAGPDGKPLGLSLELLRELFPSAFAIAMLGAIESLLSAVVSDGMAGTRHDPDAELFAQGMGNLVAPFFGGFAATGAIARTATNIRAGGRSPIAAIVHAHFVLVAVLLLAPLLSYLPMAALSALLLLVAWNMSDAKHFAHVLRVAPKSDVFVQLTCFALTVLFDMVVAVSAGVVLAAFLFMRRMAEISGARLAEGEHPALRQPLPRGVILYEINGPLFFGAAEKAMGALHDIASRARVVVLDVRSVPAMDATGLVNLESVLEKLDAHGVEVLISGVQAQPRKLLEQAGLVGGEDPYATFDTIEQAVEEAGRRAAGTA
ncbi:MAG: C4-dicarboxylic acid transporter DauA [Myxococcota bacterium]